jgi:hypothetical protein
MKKIAIVYLFLCMGLTSFAQEAKHNIKTNLLSPFLNTLNISYEVLKPNDKSIQIGLSYMNYSGYLNSETNYDYSYGYEENVKGVSATFEYRILFSEKGFNNTYIAPFFRAMHYQKKAVTGYNIYQSSQVPSIPVTTDELSKYTSIGIGFVLGRQFVFNNKVSIDLFAGPAYQILVDQYRSLVDRDTKTPFKPSNNAKLSKSINNRFLEGYGLRAGVTVGLLF